MSKYEKQLESANDDLREAVSISLSNNNNLSELLELSSAQNNNLSKLLALSSANNDDLMIRREHDRDRIFELRKYNDSLAEKLQKREMEIGDLLNQFNQMKYIWMNK